MHYNGIERRKYQRYKVAIPVNIGLIDIRRGKNLHVQFKEVTTDISMEGLGLRCNSQVSAILSVATKMMGKNKEFDLEITANLGTKDVRGVGEVRWTSMDLPHLFKMGIFLKEMREDEKEKWTNFVTSQSKNIPSSMETSSAYPT
jgi:hypothetical protein